MILSVQSLLKSFDIIKMNNVLNEFSLVIFCTNIKHFVLQKCLFFFRQQKHSLIVKLITSKQTLLKGAEFKMSSS
jgi:hypothetical protein